MLVLGVTGVLHRVTVRGGDAAAMQAWQAEEAQRVRQWMARPATMTRLGLCKHALLTPLINPGSRYRYGRST